MARTIANTISALRAAALTLAVVCVPGALAAADWPHELQRGPFRIHADFPLQRFDLLFAQLVDLDTQVSRTLRLARQSELIDVYLFRDQQAYQEYMRRYFPQVTARRAMFIKTNSPGNVFAFLSPEFETDLRHECTHAILHAKLPLVPLWLDEGLAEYFEVPASARADDNPHLAAIRRGLIWRRAPSVKRLESLTALAQMDVTEYREAWAWVHFMLHGPPAARQQLLFFLSELSRQVPPPQLSVLLHRNVAAVEKQFVQHFRSWTR